MGKIAGFKKVSENYVEDVRSDVIEYVYEKTNTKLIHIKNDDQNKSFTVGFKTVPTDSTGVAHILEHTVLKGSKKYDITKLFLELKKASLSTYLNALTASDHTMYPVASMNDNDFLNLTSVYLDVLYNPNILRDEEIFKLEGWTYELHGEKLIRNGIVLNEMKGSYAELGRIINMELMNLMFDNTYKYSSGGDPKVIPTLTYQELKDFHKKHYHPSNSIMVVYGDCNIEDVLTTIDGFISRFDKSEEVAIEKTSGHKSVKRGTSYYNVSSNNNIENSSHYAMSLMVDKTLDTSMKYAMSIMLDVLINSEASWIKQQLMSKNLCVQVGGAYRTSNIQSYNMIYANFLNKDNVEEIEAIFYEGFRKAVEEGLDKEQIKSALTKTEFNLREIQEGMGPIGVGHSMDIVANWKNGAKDVTSALKFEEDLAKVKEMCENNKLEELITTYLIGNENRAVLTLIPELGLADKNIKKTEEELEAYKQTLSEEEINNIKESMIKVNEYRDRKDSKEKVAAINLIKVSDIKKDIPKDTVIEETVEKQTGYFFDAYTNGIAYNSLRFDASILTADEVKIATLLGTFLGSVSTKSSTYQELSKKSSDCVGGIGFGLQAIQDYTDMSKSNRYFEGSFKAMSDNLDKANDLFKEIITTSEFTDKIRIKQILTMVRNSFKMGFSGSGQRFAVSRINSMTTETGAFNEHANGYEIYEYIVDLVDNFDTKFESFSTEVERVYRKLINFNNIIFSTVGNKDNFLNMKSFITELSTILPSESYEKQTIELFPKSKQAIIAASNVQNVCKGYNICKLGHMPSGQLTVALSVLDNGHLWEQIREIGGAYGCTALATPSGNVVSCSYSDPQLERTLGVYNDIPAYLEALENDPIELEKHIIGAIKNMDRPMLPQNRGMVAISNKINNRTHKMLQKHRDEVLNVTIDEIKAQAKIYKDVMEQDAIIVIGNESKINESKDLFDTIYKI